ncbi:exodeoxyribonuclease I [Pelomonas sp. KK5]|uniref:exodeoxyribonuclease I n=1 Tax=Pelomonas sp. KK5 TaxID=1855730 RepID=UPI00097C3BF5|nr:exodeoxyribonuclease I [Pelomonas sp. KK5]
MNDMTFYWHDYETFGRVPRRDRPAQFAGVRTDAELNEIGEPLMVYCQPAPDFLPDPESCLLTGILPQACLEQGVPEHEFADRIEAELARPGTIGLGYNTIRFDDEVTRYLFWRNLMDPYAREWQNGCGRWDLLDVVRCAYALRPGGITWPKHDDGRPSFKLEHLTAANGLAHEAAHDALSDVRATIALARLIRTAQPKLFEFCLRLRGKDAVWNEIGVGKPFLHISGMYGPERGCIGLVWPLAPHPTNKNELIVWDLSTDPAELLQLNAEQIRGRMFVKQEDLPEGTTRLPIKTIHVNKSPIVIGNLKTLSAEMAQRWSLDIEQGLAHAQVLAEKGRQLDGLWGAVFKREPLPPSDVDEDLYGGFLSPDDRRALQRVRATAPEQLAQRAAEGKLNFTDERLDELVFRWRARNFPASLSEAETERWQEHCAARLEQAAPVFMERIDQLSETLDDADERGQDILGALYDYAEQLA